MVAYPIGIDIQIMDLPLCPRSDHSDGGGVARRIGHVSPVFLVRFCDRESLGREAGGREIDVGRYSETSAHRNRAFICRETVRVWRYCREHILIGQLLSLLELRPI